MILINIRYWLKNLNYFLQGDQKKKKTELIYFWLKFINLILAFSFFSGYEVDSVHEKLGS